MKDGEKKFINRNVGSIIETQHGQRLKLDACFNPAGCPRDEDGGVWMALFDPKPRDSQQQGQQQRPQQNQGQQGGWDEGDSIPF
jgi:single-strand DNA-binding protein